ncbi:hypothetical protein LCX93_02780 [Sulfurimonas sp. SWIR-19]|uniref:hypothetical protein n=1 Tax=Sulfurimonas sp. SWIR-19 TaxID=2878390 RepID=UPI001CF437BE|nr:hypothetical protein [Sulfurimonas sp. SWIR-19]UCN00858.1 hypothetical protein LCX93_02780 [Sulfurimonas sp. SWIR-19]
MKYSYIKPRKKTPLTPELQIVFTFFAMTLLMLIATYSFLLYKDYTFIQDKQSIIEHKKELEASINQMQNQISFIQKQKALAEKVFTQNMVLKDSIANLFDLVPQRITLSRAQLLKNGLILYGITPNKDVYNFMLQAPLRSIFHKTYSSFYPAKNGWLMFVSTNYMDESQTEGLESEN